MEVVLLEDVKALGKKGQVVKVNDGYARNFILPKKLGVEATSKNLNDLKQTAGLYAKYGVRGIPNYVLISPEGKIVKMWSGYGKGCGRAACGG